MWLGAALCVCLLSVAGGVVDDKPRPPSITNFISQHFFNDYLEAECPVTGSPLPSVTWMKDGIPVDVSQKRITVKSGRINITRATELDEGRYHCVANNTYGETRSVSRRLAKARLTSFKTEKTLEVEGRLGSHVTLECRSRPESQPRSHLGDFTWHKGKAEVEKSPRVTTDQEGALHFLGVQKEDESVGNATYNCSVYNAATRKRVYGSPTLLSVANQASTPAQRAPKFVHTSSDTKVKVGDRLELQCIPYGDPLPEVTWTPPSGQVSVRHKTDKVSYSLTVENVDRQDNGTYVCSAMNNESSVQHPVQVSVIAKLTSHIHPEKIILPEGVTQQFECLVEESGATITWLINNQPVEEDERILVTGNALTVKEVEKPRDTLSLQCHVTKDEREHISDATLTVINAVQITTKSPSPVDIPRGEKAELNVSAEVDPDYREDLQYLWYQNKVELRTSTPLSGIRVYMADGVSHLTIDTSHLDDEQFRHVMGQYVCLVTVGVPSASKKVLFEVTSVKEGFTVPATEKDEPASLWWIGLVVAIIVGVVAVLLILYCKNRNKGDVYPVDERERQAGRDPVKELADDRKLEELHRTDEADDGDEVDYEMSTYQG